MLYLFTLTLPITDPVLIFSIVLFIIFLAPLLLQKIKVPSITGLIVAGIAIGPNGFHLLERDSSIVLFGTVGLLYIMFLAGLELEINGFKKSKNKSIVFGFFTFIIPLIIGFIVSHFLLGYNITASILIASMFATHTLVAYPIASKLGLIKNEAVTVVVGGTIITDTAVLLILAVITGSVEGSLDVGFWIKLLISIVIFSVIVFWLFPIIVRWFFKRLEGENVSQYILVLGMVFLASFLAEVAGIEPIIGAFMAGLALNNLVPRTSPLMNRIEFVGNALFIPFFLISVGMLVDLKVLFNGPVALTVAFTLTIAALVGKYLGAYATQKIFKYSVPQRNLIFGLSSAHAAATLAVILIGYNLEIIDDNVLNGTILLIFVTCLISSFVTENAGRKLAIEEGEQLPEVSEVPERILVPIANPNTIEKLIDFAIMVKEPKSQEPIYPLAVVKDDKEAKEKVILSTRMLEKAVVHASATDNTVQVITKVDLNIASGIIRAIKELMITEVIIGWNPKLRATDRIFGTALDNILHQTDQMTFVCNLINPLNTIQRLLVLMPKNADLEVGFNAWVQKIKLLASQSGADIRFYCLNNSMEKLKSIVEKGKPEINATYHVIEDWRNFSEKAESIVKNDDLIVMVSARRDTISYQDNMENLPYRLSRQFRKNSFLVLYPQQTNYNSGNTSYLQGF